MLRKGTGGLKKIIDGTRSSFGLLTQRLKNLLPGVKNIGKNTVDTAKAVTMFGKRTEVTGLAQALFGSTIALTANSLTGFRKNLKEAIFGKEEDAKATKEQTTSLRDLMKETPKYLELLAKETTALDKLNQKRFILASNTKSEENQRKALVKTIGELNKQSGLQIELGEIKNFQDLQNAITTQDKLAMNG